MKRAFYSIITLAFVAIISACSGKSATQNADTTEAADSALTIDDLLATANQYVDSLVTVEGVCTHTCSHGATKMFLIGSDDSKTIRVEACELGAFDAAVVNNPVLVKGYLREQRIDEDYLTQWAEMAAARVAETHGEAGAGCDSEKAARGVTANTVEGQIADYRARIAKQVEEGGNPYLSFYYIDAVEYDIQ